MVALDNDFQYYLDEAHQVLDGYKCFSIGSVSDLLEGMMGLDRKFVSIDK